MADLIDRAKLKKELNKISFTEIIAECLASDKPYDWIVVYAKRVKKIIEQLPKED